jgi:hypothetical protein
VALRLPAVRHRVRAVGRSIHAQPDLGGRAGASIRRSVGVTAAIATIGVYPCITGGESLPHIMLDSGRFGIMWIYLVGVPVALLSATAIAALWRRQRSILDLWLMVVMFVYIVEMPVSYYPDPSRFSPGWYAARFSGFSGAASSSSCFCMRSRPFT